MNYKAILCIFSYCLTTEIKCMEFNDNKISTIFNNYQSNSFPLHKPYFNEHEEEIDTEFSFIDYSLKNRKKILNIVINLGSLGYFCQQWYQTYTTLYKSTNCTHSSGWLQNILNCICPTLFTNIPTHINFFLTSTELLLQVFLIKTLLKMILFCFV